MTVVVASSASVKPVSIAIVTCLRKKALKHVLLRSRLLPWLPRCAAGTTAAEHVRAKGHQRSHSSKSQDIARHLDALLSGTSSTRRACCYHKENRNR